MSAAAEIAAALNAKRTSNGWMAHCVAHEDTNPSLHISEGERGPLFKCFAGCEQHAVIAELRARGLFGVQIPISFPNLGAYTSHFDYHDARGRHVQRICRWDRVDGKEVRPLSLIDGRWCWKQLDSDRPLYRLPELIRQSTDRVLIVEGEKTADAAAKLFPNFAVTTWAGGANAVNKTNWKPLAAREVILFPDNDKPGASAMDAVNRILLGIGSTVRRVDMSALSMKAIGWDIADAGADEVESVRGMIADAAPTKLEPKAGVDDSVEHQSSSTRHAINSIELRDFLALNLPPREYLLYPIVPRQGLVMIHGPRGLGKTYVSLGIAYAVTACSQFLKWKASAASGVLFIDGEMPATVLQERLSRIVAGTEKEASAPLKIITPDLNIDTGLPDLSSAQGQAAIDAHVDETIGLIILDNLSSLARSGVENDSESWLPMQTWALRHRAAGRSVLFIHHSGKGGGQRGTSRREDVLDTVIGLRRPVDYSPEQGARFEVHVEKARGFFGDEAKPFDAQLTTDAVGNQTWTLSDVDESNENRIIELHEDGLKPNDIAQELKVGRATVYRQLKKARLLDRKRSNGKVSLFVPRDRRDFE